MTCCLASRTTNSGKQSSQWRAGMPQHRKLRYQNVWPGIDIVYYGSGNRLEFISNWPLVLTHP